MKQEFEMTEEEVQAIYDISKNKMPVIYVGVWLGLDSQEQANKLWQIMADKYGFIWDSAEGSAKGDRYFLATPKPIVVPKTQTEIEIDKYLEGTDGYVSGAVRDSLKKIIEQLESCFYETEAGCLVNNVAFLALRKLSKP